MTFNFGTPVNFTEIAVNGAVIELEKTKYNKAVVQVQGSSGSDINTSTISRYNRQGIDPVAGESGFIAAKNDTIVFSSPELRKGVRFINEVEGQAIKLVIQYYNNIQFN